MSTYVSQDGKILVSHETLPTLLRTLEELGAGVSRTVYAISDTEVLKYAHNRNSHAGNNRTEWDSYHRIAESDRHYFAACYAISDDGVWMVSERAAGSAYDLGSDFGDDPWDAIQTAEDYGISDLHDGNYGFRADGSALILDYAMGEDSYCEPCGCGEHDCEDCWPDGCDCSTWHGCRETLCSRCVRKNAHRYASRSWFGFVPRKGSKVCSDCVPRKRIGWANAPREIRGQGVMIGQRIASRGWGMREDVREGTAQIAFRPFGWVPADG